MFGNVIISDEVKFKGLMNGETYENQQRLWNKPAVSSEELSYLVVMQ